MLLTTDGTNWFTFGLGGILAGSQLGYGALINGTLVQTTAANAVTFAVKTLAGNDPTPTDPVLVNFRNVMAGTGNFVYRSITAACSVTLSSGSTVGTANGIASRVWLGLLDNAGTPELFAINCLSGTSIYPLGQFPIISTTAEGGAGAADSAHVAYSTSARSSKPYVVLGYAGYESGQSTAGAWSTAPTRLQLYGPGVPMPGTQIQPQQNFTGAVATGTTVIPLDDTIPQNTEGDQYMSQAITPTSAANLLEIEAKGVFAGSNAGYDMIMALFQDTTASALTATNQRTTTNGNFASQISIAWSMLAGVTSATTFKIRAGMGTAGTTTFNGASAARLLGGVMNSYIRVREIMA